jgi:plastocyanin
MRFIRSVASILIIASVAGCAAHRILPPPARTAEVHGRAALGDHVEVRDVVVYATPLRAPSAHSTSRARRLPATITQAHHTFTPRVLTIQQGQSVVFHNGDTVWHSVFSISPARRFDVGRYGPGEHRSVTFDRSGIVNLYCALDSQMAGWVLVLPTPSFTRPDATGSFTIAGLVPGSYTIHVWDPERGERTRRVDVTAPGTVVMTAPL